MDAIMVNENNGMYEIAANAEDENWYAVKLHGHVQKRENLAGWGKYTAAYTLEMPHMVQWYFVAEEYIDEEGLNEMAHEIKALVDKGTEEDIRHWLELWSEEGNLSGKTPQEMAKKWNDILTWEEEIIAWLESPDEEE